LPYLQPIKDRVLVYRDPMSEESDGRYGKAIHLPGNRKTPDEERSNVSVKGTVINVGEDVDQAWIAPGDRVVYRWYTGDELLINRKRCVLIYANEILARDLREGE